ncbi:hypothetical protein [Loktanella salsilacus]|uniref:alpha-glutamyl/putrescinyl thymine pyrophosphorylase clade 3 protein n=1 Tax=Loktanella salsilacus TaxID=195913 RepID=UPI003703E0CF
MWPSRKSTYDAIKTSLTTHNKSIRDMPGIHNTDHLNVLSTQIVASVRREDYYQAVQRGPIPPRMADPNSESFDAERAAHYHISNGNIDEASWLIFLMTHFAKPPESGWLRLRDVYGRLGQGIWTWADVSSDPNAFADWLDANWHEIRGKFGNHRKYESIRPTANRNMRRVVNDYTAWIGQAGHGAFFAQTIQQAGNDPHNIFDYFYRDMTVLSFGRLAKFDYLTLLARYNLAPIYPGSAYLNGATGPRAGASLLFTGGRNSNLSVEDLQLRLDELDKSLSVGMAVIEDALCNWQKSPAEFEHYLG